MTTSVRAPRGKLISKAVASAVGMVLFCSLALQAQSPIHIPMTPDRWETKDNVEFSQSDAFPLGIMKVTRGVAVLKSLNFSNGTIEFDVIPNGPMGAGIGFRRRDDETFEDFYLRPRPRCDQAVDCMQYAPQTHGVLLWDVFPQYQGPAPLKDDGANHIKLVVSGRRMNIYVNGAATPTLTIGRLEGDTTEGGILMQGPGTFANLTVIPDAIDGLSPEPLSDPAAQDKRFLRSWLVSPSSELPDGKEPTYAELPAAGEGWRPVSAERGGLVNLSRNMGLPNKRKGRDLAWLKTSIDSNQAQTRHVSIGWSREIWVFVNGKPVYSDKNLYQPPSARKSPDGRLSLENGSFDLPLKKGRNEITIALANNFYGWGIEMRLDELQGLKIADSKNLLAAKQ